MFRHPLAPVLIALIALNTATLAGFGTTAWALYRLLALTGTGPATAHAAAADRSPADRASTHEKSPSPDHRSADRAANVDPRLLPPPHIERPAATSQTEPDQSSPPMGRQPPKNPVAPSASPDPQPDRVRHDPRIPRPRPGPKADAAESKPPRLPDYTVLQHRILRVGEALTRLQSAIARAAQSAPQPRSGLSH